MKMRVIVGAAMLIVGIVSVGGILEKRTHSEPSEAIREVEAIIEPATVEPEVEVKPSTEVEYVIEAPVAVTPTPTEVIEAPEESINNEDFFKHFFFRVKQKFEGDTSFSHTALYNTIYRAYEIDQEGFVLSNVDSIIDNCIEQHRLEKETQHRNLYICRL